MKMLEILSLIGGIKTLILGAIGLLGGLWALWAKNKMNRQKETISQQDRAIGTYKVKEQVHEQDVKRDEEVNQRISEIQEKVDHAETPEAGAGEVSGAINDYFRGDRK